jgi:hypothetical protein
VAGRVDREAVAREALSLTLILRWVKQAVARTTVLRKLALLPVPLVGPSFLFLLTGSLIWRYRTLTLSPSRQIGSVPQTMYL